MSEQLYIPSVSGLQPLIDRRKIAEPFVVDGRNFIVDTDGPFSGLGRTMTAYKAINTVGNIQTFRIAENLESFICNNEGIFSFDSVTETTLLLYKFAAPITSEFPWSMAAVGNKYYFSRKGSDLIEFDIFTDAWTTLTGGSIPTDAYACIEADGRLIILSALFVSWSAIGVGTDFVASTTTGAGAQALTKLGLSAPKPLGIQVTPDGFLTFLSSGIMKSQSLIAVNPYRHTILSRKHVIVNPYCITRDENDEIIFLSKTGLYKTSGEKPAPYQQALGEYLHTVILPKLNLETNQNNIQIDYNYGQSWFSVWIAENQQPFVYTKAYIVNAKIDQMGCLNASFTALVNIEKPNQISQGFNFSLIDLEGSIYSFDQAQGIEIIPLLSSGYTYWSSPAEVAAQKVDSVLYFGTNTHFDFLSKAEFSSPGLYYDFTPGQSAISPTSRVAVDLPAGLNGTVLEFSTDSVFGFGVVNIDTVLQSSIFDPLDSSVVIGPVRLFDQIVSDRLSNLINISLGTLESAVGDTFDDWMSDTQYPTEVITDWESFNGAEDWGEGASSGVNYSIQLHATLDGKKDRINHTPTIHKIKTSGGVVFYGCFSAALYHLIEISAKESTQNYAVKTLDLTLANGGRIV